MQRYISLFVAVPALLGEFVQASPVNNAVVRDASGDDVVSVVWVTETNTITSCPAVVTSTIFETTTICPETVSDYSVPPASGVPTPPETWNSHPASTSHASSAEATWPASSKKAETTHASSSKKAETTHASSTKKAETTHASSSKKAETTHATTTKKVTTTKAETTHKTSTKAAATPTGDLPTLDSTQTKYAREIIAEAKKENLGKQGCEAGIATALVETNLLMYANSNVPASLNYPHDAVGSDYDSVGLFQQRVSDYPNLAADMNASESAAQFFAQMKKVSGWQTMNVGTLCQDVQRSAYPDRYSEKVSQASQICEAGGY